MCQINRHLRCSVIFSQTADIATIRRLRQSAAQRSPVKASDTGCKAINRNERDKRHLREGVRSLVLVGQRKALDIAVKGSRARRRWSKLREWLIGSDTPSAKRVGSRRIFSLMVTRARCARRSTAWQRVFGSTVFVGPSPSLDP